MERQMVKNTFDICKRRKRSEMQKFDKLLEVERNKYWSIKQLFDDYVVFETSQHQFATGARFKTRVVHGTAPLPNRN